MTCGGAFGTRWARRVMPATLRRLMRQAAIGTTMAYYVDLDADDIAGELWQHRDRASHESITTFSHTSGA